MNNYIVISSLFLLIVVLTISLFAVLNNLKQTKAKLGDLLVIDHSSINRIFYPKALFERKTNSDKKLTYIMKAAADIDTPSKYYEISQEDFIAISEFPIGEKAFVVKSKPIRVGVDSIHFVPAL